MKLRTGSAFLALLLLPVTLMAELSETALSFPKDHGSHLTPENHVTEWWNIKGEIGCGNESYTYRVGIFQQKKESGRIHYWVLQSVTDLQSRIVTCEPAEFTSEEVFLSEDRLSINFGDKIILKQSEDNSFITLKFSLSDDERSYSGEIHSSVPSEPLLHSESTVVDDGEDGKAYSYTLKGSMTSGSLRDGSRYITIDPAKSLFVMDHKWGSFAPEHYGWKEYFVTTPSGYDVWIRFRTAGGVIIDSSAAVKTPHETWYPENISVTESIPWVSPESGRVYNLAAQIELELDDDRMVLNFTSLFPEQEFNSMYWGTCTTDIHFQGQRVSGTGFMDVVDP